jgi:hypothetical protein
VSFTALLELDGKTATGITVPAEIVEGPGAGRQPPVVLTINGVGYRTAVAVRGGRRSDALTASQQKAFAHPVEQAKKPETRARRIAAAVERARRARSASPRLRARAPRAAAWSAARR